MGNKNYTCTESLLKECDEHNLAHISLRSHRDKEENLSTKKKEKKETIIKK